MDLTDRQQVALLAIQADLEGILNGPNEFGYGFAKEKRRLRLAQAGFVDSDMCRWIGLVGSPANYVKAHRVLGQLTRLGLIKRNGGVVGLTEAGEALAKQMVSET